MKEDEEGFKARVLNKLTGILITTRYVIQSSSYRLDPPPPIFASVSIPLVA